MTPRWFLHRLLRTDRSVLLLHGALLLVLIGGLLTHFTGLSGHLTLRAGEPADCFADSKGFRHDLPFSLFLDTCSVIHHPGTEYVAQYTARLHTSPDGRPMQLSVNRIERRDGFRFYLMACHPETHSIRLDIRHDTAGTACAYTGFALFLATFTARLIRRHRRQRRRTAGHRSRPGRHRFRPAGIGLLVLLGICLVVHFIQRWRITGYVPLASGYDTLTFTALCLCITALAVRNRFPFALPGGLLLAGCMLFGAHLHPSAASGQVAPVLRSPLLFLHVSVILFSYTLLAFTFFHAIAGLVAHRLHHPRMVRRLQRASQALLAPAVLSLSAGIALGAVWSNISWGGWWSWDPKELWALLTLLVYVVPLHRRVASALSARGAAMYHLYMGLAFLVLLMTWFGVRLLGGMHSYA